MFSIALHSGGYALSKESNLGASFFFFFFFFVHSRISHSIYSLESVGNCRFWSDLHGFVSVNL
ncbi:hypothetical protein JHK87_008423 [Glycine soja]|nr:hypothetical protein JHK87_008423 [Glycine soja]